MLGGITRKIEARIRKVALSPRHWLFSRVRPIEPKIVRLGSHYGGWHVAEDRRLHGAVALLAGAGEDITFDLALQRHYQCHVIIVDPTPRAIAHVNAVLVAAKFGGIVQSKPDAEQYAFSCIDLQRIAFLPVALWHTKTVLKFWVPRNSDHVSHSATNIQGTSDFIEVPALSISQVLRESGADLEQLELIKLDIEGAETQVIGAMLDGEIRPTQLLVEFDEIHFPTRESVANIRDMVLKLEAAGYVLAHYDGLANCLFYSA